MTTYRVFTQSDGGRLDPVKLVQHAQRHFSCELELLAAEGPAANLTALHVRITPPHSAALSAHITRRASNEADLAAARRAEQNGSSAGMSLLAARCAHIWEIALDPTAIAPSVGAVLLCGVLASVALGPVLPPDESALFGVRGALERAAKLRFKP